MQTARRRLLRALLLVLSFPSSSSLTTFARWSAEPLNCIPDGSFPRATLGAPWAAIQTRGAKVLGSYVRLGNVIQRKGRIYQVLKAQHTQHGRGRAIIQVELRDVDSSNKSLKDFLLMRLLRGFLLKRSHSHIYTRKVAL